MRHTLPVVLLVGALACAGDRLTNDNMMRAGEGPAFTVVVGTRVIADTGGALALEAFASIKNETTVHLGLVQCQPHVELVSDPTSQHPGSLDGSMACPSGSPTLDMAPGDSTMQSRVLSAATLAAYAPGQYSAGIVVTSTTGLSGLPLGEVLLPLSAP